MLVVAGRGGAVETSRGGAGAAVMAARGRAVEAGRGRAMAMVGAAQGGAVEASRGGAGAAVGEACGRDRGQSWGHGWGGARQQPWRTIVAWWSYGRVRGGEGWGSSRCGALAAAGVGRHGRTRRGGPDPTVEAMKAEEGGAAAWEAARGGGRWCGGGRRRSWGASWGERGVRWFDDWIRWG